MSEYSNETLSAPSLRKILAGYCSLLTIITFIGTIFAYNELVGFLGFWLVWLELLMGLTAAGSLNILTSMSTLQAQGKPITETTLWQQRLKDEANTFRTPWLIIFLINSVILMLFTFTFYLM